MYKLLTKKKKKKKILRAHEKVKSVASPNAIFKRYKSFFSNICKTPCDGSKLFKKLTLSNLLFSIAIY